MQQVAVCRKPIAAPMERPSEDEALVRLKSTVGATLKTALEKQFKELSVKDTIEIGEHQSNCVLGLYEVKDTADVEYWFIPELYESAGSKANGHLQVF